MSKKILSRELIVSETFKMIDENGIDAFSIRKLATKLGVQPSSLYNHIKNEYDLLLEVVKLTSTMYTDRIEKTVTGLSIEEATYKAGDAFRGFMNEHKYLYELLLDRRWIGDTEFYKATERFIQPSLLTHFSRTLLTTNLKICQVQRIQMLRYQIKNNKSVISKNQKSF